MPRGDRTGPNGYGPMTGRGAGFCAGYDAPGYVNSGYGGRGRGFGRGMGWGRGPGRFPYYAPPPVAPRYAPTQQDERAYLEATIEDLEEELKAVKGRLAEMEKSD